MEEGGTWGGRRAGRRAVAAGGAGKVSAQIHCRGQGVATRGQAAGGTRGLACGRWAWNQLAEAAWAPETGLGGRGNYGFCPAVKGTTKGPRVTSWTDQGEHPGDSVASGSAFRASARHTCASTGPAGKERASALRVSVGENGARSLTAVCAKAGHRDFAEG